MRRLREAYNAGKGISQTDLAKKLSKTPNTISRWETGEYKPKIEDLYELAKFFRVSILEFLPNDEDESNIKLQALFRSANSLDDDDREEVTKFAEFRLAQKKYKERGKTPPVKKRKK
ncbi:XRE family transcriptional regulator [Leptospira stimsonii]|uniref:XRE family transcriptional regulator n=1 Tax=Leptospira stimsonii TaxID=2202203 RepID=A0ABY2N573_9LEPT|nr:XRE family transcriptional regulator [Leptospira stimsonii]TGM16936.1 XRE family transcriptional regulator [Leptospira stimsonii]